MFGLVLLTLCTIILTLGIGFFGLGVAALLGAIGQQFNPFIGLIAAILYFVGYIILLAWLWAQAIGAWLPIFHG